MKKCKKKTARDGWTSQAVLPEPVARGGDLCHDHHYYTTLLQKMQQPLEGAEA